MNQVRDPPALPVINRSLGSLAVAPGDELVERAEIVVRAGRLSNEVGDPGGQVVVELVELRAEDLGGALDLFGISSDFGAPLVEDPVLAAELVRLTLAIPDGRVLGDDAEGDLFPAAADEDRERLTHRTGTQPGETFDNDRQVAIEIAQARGRRAELVAVLLV